MQAYAPAFFIYFQLVMLIDSKNNTLEMTITNLILTRIYTN